MYNSSIIPKNVSFSYIVSNKNENSSQQELQNNLRIRINPLRKSTKHFKETDNSILSTPNSRKVPQVRARHRAII